MVAHPVSGPRQQAWIRALDRARLVSTRKPTYVIALDAYRVHSDRADVDYMIHPVEVDGHLTYECSCKAGESGQVCWHAALIAALPGEVSRRRRHREQRQAERSAFSPQDAVLVAGVAPQLAEMFA
jgi:hypothetical protein